MQIVKANFNHLDHLALLFNAYRILYKLRSNINGVKAFLENRIKANESIIYIAYSDDTAVGFTQLNPLNSLNSLNSSVSMQSMYVLNNLYVHNDYRQKGIGKTLINKAKQLCVLENNKSLAIQTDFDNPAQQLYTRCTLD
ncbi:GNAT family N-acetyltransferase [Winogradskyella sp.]|uniref:GNAT family N-acetyltransferase n=1 Tax=Winogradskyella sp. TaxID=1883156 RepID=UPI003703710D